MKAIKPVLFILAALAIGGAAYYSSEHATRFKEEQAVRLKEDKERDTVSALADAVERAIDKEKIALQAAKVERDSVNQSIETKRVAGAELKRKIADKDAEIKDQDAELAEVTKAMKEIAEILKGLGDDVDLDNFAAKMEEIRDKKKSLEGTHADRLDTIAKEEARLKANNTEANRLTDKKMDRIVRISRNAMEARISSVQQDWGFVVVGAGSNTGFTPQTGLLVKRDGRVIARLKPTAIERAQTICDVEPDSIAPGVRLQVGDSVILAKPLGN